MTAYISMFPMLPPCWRSSFHKSNQNSFTSRNSSVGAAALPQSDKVRGESPRVTRTCWTLVLLWYSLQAIFCFWWWTGHFFSLLCCSQKLKVILWNRNDACCAFAYAVRAVREEISKRNFVVWVASCCYVLQDVWSSFQLVILRQKPFASNNVQTGPKGALSGAMKMHPIGCFLLCFFFGRRSLRGLVLSEKRQQ